MNAGEFKDKIEILELVESSADAFEWLTMARVWVKTEQQTKNNIFSRNGLSALSIKFTIRELPALTPFHALRWGGQFCFLTHIDRGQRAYYVLSAALIEPRQCAVTRTLPPIVGELNAPVYLPDKTITFPGCLTEKYYGSTVQQREPMTVLDTRYVLVVPKVIELRANEVVVIDGVSYIVFVPHTLDEYKNEYEIGRKGEN